MTRRLPSPFNPAAPALLSCLVLACICPNTLAQQSAESSPSSAASEDRAALNDALDEADLALHIEVVAGVWSPRLSGDSKYNTGLGTSRLSLQNQLDLHDIESTFSLELTLDVQDLAVRFSGLNFSTEGSGTFFALPPGATTQQFGDLTLASGDAYKSDFDLWTATAEAHLEVLNIAHKIGGDEGIVSLAIVPVLGMRWLDVEQSIAVGPVKETNDSQWVLAQFGGAFSFNWNFAEDFPIAQGITVDVTGLYGKVLGSDEGIVWELRAGVTINFTDNLGVALGYRLLNFDLTDDDYELDAGLQGLFIAGSLKF